MPLIAVFLGHVLAQMQPSGFTSGIRKLNGLPMNLSWSVPPQLLVLLPAAGMGVHRAEPRRNYVDAALELWNLVMVASLTTSSKRRPRHGDLAGSNKRISVRLNTGD
jgi:hypothetical protein